MTRLEITQEREDLEPRLAQGFFMFLFGVYPKPVLELMESTLTMLVKGIGG